MIISKPESCRDLGRLAVWGLLQFLVSYKITLELDAHGINHLLVDVPHNKKQSCVEICNSLGLIHTMIHTITGMLGCLSLLNHSSMKLLMMKFGLPVLQI